MARIDQVRAALIDGQVLPNNSSFFDHLADEVEYALFPTVHEGKEPSYGCIITNDLTTNKSGVLAVKGLPRDTVRQLSDGISSFAIGSKGILDRLFLCDFSVQDELQLIALAVDWKGILIHRKAQGEVRVYTLTGVHVFSSGQWNLRPYSIFVRKKVSETVPQADWGILSNILDFCFHSLSPSRVGATILWWLDTNSCPPTGKVDLAQAGLRIHYVSHNSALRSILRQHDGATVVAPNGEVMSLGYQLRYSQTSVDLIPEIGGTRHTSAKRYSFDEPNAVLFVVSEDGPVSVFSDGIKLTELAQLDVGEMQKMLSDSAPEKKTDISTELEPVRCPKCLKLIVAEIVTVVGWKDREVGYCPLCGTEAICRKCYSIHTRLRKLLPTESDSDVRLSVSIDAACL